ncbi:MAG: leucyl aminopeptidase [Propionibacteriaceae bacterium]|jgi:leucyl aminopeptidase|nr:leucyl aminopeptidase [Propionibacteriaceae bacterium]
MTTIRLTPTIPSYSYVDTLVVGLAADDGEPELVALPAGFAAAYASRHGQTPLTAARLVGATAKPNRVRLVPDDDNRRLAVVGLGSAALSADQLRRAAASAVRTVLASEPRPSEAIALSFGPLTPAAVQAVVEGALIGAYRFAPLGHGPKPAALAALAIVTPDDPEAVTAAVAGQVVARAVIRACDWVNQPPNLLDPAAMAAEATALAEASGLTVNVADEHALALRGFGGLLAVGGGSARPPRLVQVTWAPPQARATVALVGKGITFDSGGLNLKPPSSMATMKNDMSGAAACLAAVAAAAELDLPVRVTAWLALAENLPSGSAYRMSDVISVYGGTTVENYNSDAEGRLVLADALARAVEDAPDLMVDVATLTGACVVALGHQTIGLMTSDTTVADHLLDAAAAAGESTWPLPITPEAEEVLASKVADLRSGGQREGGALVAAAFLRRFTGGRPWAHLDIAGPAFHTGEPHDTVPSGATGAGVRTLVALLRAVAG